MDGEPCRVATLQLGHCLIDAVGLDSAMKQPELSAELVFCWHDRSSFVSASKAEYRGASFSSVASIGSGGYAGLAFSGIGGVWTAISGSQLLTFSELTGQLRFTLNSAPVPEIDPSSLGSAVALLAGALGLLERRVRSRKRG